MKKERLFYLDFIRAVATIMILMCHYNAVFIYFTSSEVWHKNQILGSFPCGIYIGNFAVALFFIISGASLMYVHGDRNEKYFIFEKKRLKALFPMFYLAYLIVFLLRFIEAGGLKEGVPRRNMIFTFLGMDGMLDALCGGRIPTFYILGEWFLGVIILLYLLFPLLSFGINKYPKITAVIIIILYFIFVLFHGDLNNQIIVFTRIPEFAFGMYFVKYIKKVNYKVVLPCLVVLVLNTIFRPGIDQMFQTTYVGICTFLCMVWLSNYIGFGIVKKICFTIGKYSFAIYLVHHVIISDITAKFDLNAMTRTESVICFIACCTFTFIAAYILFKADKFFQTYIGSLIEKKKEEEKRK